jgi:hypothetical protein
MTWIRNNPFIAGLAGVLVAGAAAFGVLIYSAYGKFSAVEVDYAKQAGELKRLQTLSPYPEQANYEKLKQQQDGYISQINGLSESVARMQLPVEPLSPERFQDELKAAVTNVSARARQNGTSLPEKFYLGFENYQALPPKTEAAPLLGRQLRAIEMVMGAVLDARASVTAITRQNLPAEQPPASASTARPPANAAVKATDDSGKLVSSTSFGIDLVAEQSQLRSVLNALANEQRQLFVVRSLRIENQNKKGPSRAEVQAPVSTGQPAAGVFGQEGAEGATAAGATPSMQFVVGDEKLLVSLKIDIMEFAPPKAGKGK